MNWLALLALIASQDPASPEQPAWVVLDSAALIVNEDIITDLEVVAAQRRLPNPSASEEERMLARNRIVAEKVRNLLQEQAGELMGYEQKMIDRFVESEVERQREDAGSVTRLASELKARNLDSFTHKDEIRTYVYGMLWQRSQTGVDAGAKGRVAADRYVRPGRVYFEFKSQEERLANDPLVTVHSVGLRIVRSPEEVREALTELRRRAMESGDFDGEVERFDGGRTKPEVIEDRPLSAFRGSRELSEFLRSSEPGAISEVLEIRTRGVLDGYRLVYFAERKSRSKPSFTDPALQANLRDEVRTSLDNLRIATGLERLRRAAYVWPPEALGREATIEN